MRTTLPLLGLLGALGLAACVEGRQLSAADAQQMAASLETTPGAGSAVPALLAALGPATLQGQVAPLVSDALAVAAHVTQSAEIEEPACPPDMVLVAGQYCPKVEQRCVRWMETTGRYAYFRCAEYARPAKCLAERKSMRFCIDRDEYVPPNEDLPAQNQSWTQAMQVCASLGKRVCMESEWIFACEGEEMRPYPYGFTRDAAACNADRMDIYRRDGQLRDLRAGPSSHPNCVSPFGVHHLSGNLEEWTTIDNSFPPRPAMKGAYWQPTHNNCRAAQTAHDQFYRGTETGFRCCSDAR